MYLLEPPPEQTPQQVSFLQGLFFQQSSYYMASSLEGKEERKKEKKQHELHADQTYFT